MQMNPQKPFLSFSHVSLLFPEITAVVESLASPQITYNSLTQWGQAHVFTALNIFVLYNAANARPEKKKKKNLV